MKYLLILLALSSLTANAQSHGEIIGQAQTSENKSVAYASVSLYYGDYLIKTILADAEGIFIFDNIQPGVYSIIASSGSGKSRRSIVWVKESDVTYVNLVVPRSKSDLPTSSTHSWEDRVSASAVMF
jgi:hypothetical protein